VAALDAELARTLEARARARRADARDERQGTIPGAVDDVEPLAAQPAEVEPLGKPGRQAEHRGGELVPRGEDRDGAAHREADEQRPPRARRGGDLERGRRVLDTGVE